LKIRPHKAVSIAAGESKAARQAFYATISRGEFIPNAPEHVGRLGRKCSLAPCDWGVDRGVREVGCGCVFFAEREEIALGRAADVS